VVSVSFPERLLEMVDSLAKETKLPRSAVIQTLVRDGLADYFRAPWAEKLEEVEEAFENNGVDSFELPDGWGEYFDFPDVNSPVSGNEFRDLYTQVLTLIDKKVGRA